MEATNRPLVKRTVRQQRGGDMISLRDIVDTILRNWYWFIISVVACLGLARLYLATKPNVYQRQAVMLVKDDANGTGGSRKNISTDALMSLNGVLSGSSVKNEVYILQSFQLCKQVALDLNLDVVYSHKERFKSVSLYEQKPFQATFTDSAYTQASFKVTVTNQQECVLSDFVTPEGKLTNVVKAKFGEEVQTPAGMVTLVACPDYIEKFQGEEIFVTHLTAEEAGNSVRSRIATSEVDKESTLVAITCTDTDIKRADDILSALLEAYKRSIIEDKNQIAQSTAEFIDDRIDLISKELSDVEGELASFKTQNNLVNFEQNTQTYLQQSSTARQRTIQLEAQYATIQYLFEYLNQNSSENSLIPTLGGVADAGIQAQITTYNQTMLQRNRLAANSSENAPTIKELDDNLSQMRATVISSIQGYLSSVRVQLNQAKQEEKALQGGLATVPDKEKQALDITRQQAIKETLYTYLLNKREETTLQLAITEANIRIVEQPYGSNMPISPRRKVVMLVALLLGVILPLVYFRIKAMLNMGVRGREDIEQATTIPVVGEIPHRKEGIGDADILVGDNMNDSISEAFRMLRYSLDFINKDARVVMFTSTTPGEGKTFISRNYAVALSMTGKKVVLIDADIRKRTQTKLSGVRIDQGLTSFLAGVVDDVASLVVQDEKDDRLHLIPAGPTPPNPAELLMSNRLDLLIEKLKEEYDYILIDNVPAQMVADAGIVNRVVDVTVYVIREGKVDRRYLKEIERLHQEERFKRMCIVLNDSHFEKKRYGYGYGYYANSSNKKRFFGKKRK